MDIQKYAELGFEIVGKEKPKVRDKKKKIAIVTDEVACRGGIEIALINLLKSIDFERYEVTLFTYSKQNLEFYIGEIPSYVKVVYTKQENGKSAITSDLKKCRFFRVIQSFFARIAIRFIKSDPSKYLRYLYVCYPLSSEKYDLAISYHRILHTMPYTLSAICAKKKAVVFHARTVLEELAMKGFYENSLKFDKIFCVSKSVKTEIDKRYSKLSSKTEVCHNIISIDDIIEKSNEEIINCFYDNYTNIVTVGRLHVEKGQDMVPEAVRLLIDAGYNVKWYLVGDGDFREKVEVEIKKYNVDDNVILLGTKSNPYPYIKNCDIYVQTSYSEGWGITVQEAKILRKPIVVTNLEVFGEQIKNNENGIIADGVSPEALFEGIKMLIDSSELREKFVENLSHEKCDNSSELEKIYKLIED